ncbi:MAG: hypothetical protein WCY19_02605 [Candidatus Gastranaerophilaceae bacterium]
MFSYLDVICEKSEDNPLKRLILLYISQSVDWQYDWFKSETVTAISDLDSYKQNSQFELSDDWLEDLETSTVKDVKIKKLKVSYFRGIRENLEIEFSQALNIISGENTSGKTTISEAIEWLFTGQILRKINDDKVAHTELKDFITNKFKPNDTDVIVELTITEDSVEKKLKRILTSDYTTARNFECESDFYINDELLDEIQEKNYLKSIISLSPPISAQYHLSKFVKSKPDERTSYFESIFNVVSLSDFIEKLTFAPLRLKDIKSRNDDKFLNILNKYYVAQIDNMIQENDINKLVSDDYIAHFNITDDSVNVSNIEEVLNNKYSEEINKQIPFYEALKFTKESPQNIFDTESIKNIIPELTSIKDKNEELKKQYSEITKAKIAIAQAFDILKNEKLISINDEMYCPLCDYQEAKSLKKVRIEEISEWIPAKEKLSELTSQQNNYIRIITAEFKNEREMLPLYIPDLNGTDTSIIKNEELKTALDFLVEKSKQIYSEIKDNLNGVNEHLLELEKIMQTNLLDYKCIDLVAQINSCIQNLNTKKVLILEYQAKFNELKTLVESESTNDEIVYIKDNLTLLENPSKVIEDINWKLAKDEVQEAGNIIREKTKEFREKVIKQQENSFNNLFIELWNLVRKDTHTIFKGLKIGEVSGRGQKSPIELECKLKKKIGSDISYEEASVCCVFSESQINLLGIIAFIVKCQKEGQKFVIFDDPVQSMDREHFNRFANKIIDYLNNINIQIFIFTHNYEFGNTIKLINEFGFNSKAFDVECKPSTGVVCNLSKHFLPTQCKLIGDYLDDNNVSKVKEIIRDTVERFYKALIIKFNNWQNEPKRIAAVSSQGLESMWGSQLSEKLNNKYGNEIINLKSICALSNDASHDKEEPTYQDFCDAFSELKNTIDKILTDEFNISISRI